MRDDGWILYGANGFTGEVTAEEAARRGMRPVLAGRREEAVRPIAERLGLPWRAFPVEEPGAIARALEGARAILLDAGPFSKTSAPVVEACLRAGVHYLDITGEIAVFEACHARSDEARARGIVVLPGVGFDVVPSDCLAAALKEALPGAVRLELAFASDGRPSQGTVKTALEGAAQGGAVREGGRIRRVPSAWRVRTVPFRDRPRRAVSIPWGDVSTAYFSTGIPDIVVYMALAGRAVTALRALRPLAPIVALPSVQRLAAWGIERSARGPGASARATARSHLWGRVEDAAGRAVEGTLEAPGGYTLTVATSLECVARVLAGGVAPGAHTPSTAFGARFITTFPGCDLAVG